jgi:hypothetical protein
MNIATWTLIFSILSLLTSCQVKETSGNKGLISGHRPANNAFTLGTPAAGTRITGDILALTLSFPYEVTVNTTGGTPGLGITIGANTREALYISGNGTKQLTFTYTIVVADNDNNGITVTGLNLNGGTLTFDDRGLITNCSTTLEAKTLSNVLVDNTGPSIIGFTQTNLPGFYRIGNTLNFRMTFDERVYVTATPRIQLTFTTGGSVFANYAGGSGTTGLNFSYTISDTVADIDGYVIASTIDLDGGTLTDAIGNDATLTFAGLVGAVETYSASVSFDGRQPFVTNVLAPANGTYISAQNLDVTLVFNRAVNVTGNPYINLTIGSTVRQAAYLSGTGSSTLVFRYTTVPGDMDSDGITIANTVTQNGGQIVGIAAPFNSYFTALNNVLSIPSTTGVLVGAVQPQAISVTRNIDNTEPVWGIAPDNVWIIGQQLLVTVGFNTGIFVNQTLGTPRIPITIGATVKFATYLSGGDGQTSLIFTYTIVEGDLDTDGSIDIADIDLNGSTITDSSTTNAVLTLPISAIASTRIDGVRPTLTVTAPANGTYSQVNRTTFNFTASWSEAVDYSAINAAAAYIPLDIGGTIVNAVYVSGNRTNTVVHRPASLAGTNDADGIVVASPFAGTGTIRDQAGNAATVLTFVPPITTGVFVDTTAPTVQSVSSPAPGRYRTANNLDFELTFSESVTVNTTGGLPYIQIRIGNNTRNATVISAGTGTTHIFRYTIVATDTDPDFVTYQSNNITIPGASYIRDAGLNNLNPATFSDPTWTGVEVDEVAPTITAATTTAGTYISANTIVISVTFSEEVVVDTGGGTPSIFLDVATGAVEAEYNAGTSTPTILRFDYNIDDEVDLDLDGLSLAAPTNIQLNGGTIEDLLENSAILTLGTVTNLSTVYIVPHATVWMKASTTNNSGFTVKPNITTTAGLTAGYYNFGGDEMSFSSLGDVHALYMAIRTPAAGFPAQNLIAGGSVYLENDSDNIDITTIISSDVRIGSGYIDSGDSHPMAMTTATTEQIEFLFPDGVALPNSPFIPSDFSGDVAEIIIFEAQLSAGQQNAAFEYIKNAYAP